MINDHEECTANQTVKQRISGYKVLKPVYEISSKVFSFVFSYQSNVTH